jgi:hypothetical protein
MQSPIGTTGPNSGPSPSDQMAIGSDEEPTLVDVLAGYAAAGFDGDAFASEGGMILCGACQSKLSPDHIDVHSIRRLEGTSDPSDNIGVVAIVCPVCGSQATMVLKYGPEASSDEVAIWHQTNDRRNSIILPSDMAPGEDGLDVSVPVVAPPKPSDMPPPIEFE